MNKKISEMSEKEILRQQLELLAEMSEEKRIDLIIAADAMTKIVRTINDMPIEIKAEEIQKAIIEGKITINQAREMNGLKPLSDAVTGKLLIKA